MTAENGFNRKLIRYLINAMVLMWIGFKIFDGNTVETNYVVFVFTCIHISLISFNVLKVIREDIEIVTLVIFIITKFEAKLFSCFSQ